MTDAGIAIVGMAGRFPGAGNVQELWRNLVDGVESIRPPDRPAPPGVVPAVAAMDDADRFDAPFFGISPAFAGIMDPQHRVFMEVAWEALEDAGCDPTEYTGVAGVYAGARFRILQVARSADLSRRASRSRALHRLSRLRDAAAAPTAGGRTNDLD
jgi:acyl transferase domain-containing protein